MAFTLPTSGKLSVTDLMTKGYFPDRVIPPVNALGLGVALPDMMKHIQPIMADLIAKKPNKYRSRSVTHSVPKRKHLRRSLSIPNPLHQFMIATQIAHDWKAIHKFCRQSPFSLSVPVLGTDRAVSPQNDLSSPASIQSTEIRRRAFPTQNRHSALLPFHIYPQHSLGIAQQGGSPVRQEVRAVWQPD